MRAQHPSTADEIDHLVHRRGAPKIRRTVTRASARNDRRSARRALEILTVPRTGGETSGAAVRLTRGSEVTPRW